MLYVNNAVEWLLIICICYEYVQYQENNSSAIWFIQNTLHAHTNACTHELKIAVNSLVFVDSDSAFILPYIAILNIGFSKTYL